MAEGAQLKDLTEAECLAAVATEPVGRLAFNMPDGFPIVTPVNFVVERGVVVFRTGAGTKVDKLPQTVTFEVDHIDPVSRTGWSVLVRGTVYEATHWEVDHVGLEPWTAGPKNRWFRIIPSKVTGRRIDAPEEQGR